MRRFAMLLEALERAPTPEDARDVLEEYFGAADAAEAACALRLLAGSRLPRVVAGRELAEWARGVADVPPWLFDQCRAVVGDLSETIALLLDGSECAEDVPLPVWIEERLPELRRLAASSKRARVVAWWTELDRPSIHTLNRLLSATFRSPVRPAIAMEAFAAATGSSVEAVAERHGLASLRVERQQGDEVDESPPARHTVRMVLVYAHPGRGPTAGWFADYSFAVWRGEELVAVARTAAGLSGEEIRELDRWARRHTSGRFGPVRAVEPARVFEIGFEAVERSTRHRSGLTVRRPRVVRRLADRPGAEADRIEILERMIETHPDEGPPGAQGDFFAE